MTSIKEKQPGEPRGLARARRGGKAKNRFFCTAAATGGARPMNIRQVDDGNLWFLSAADSSQNRELAADPSVKPPSRGRRSDFLALSSRATVSTDRAKSEELWEPLNKTRFTGGVDDPRITVIRVAGHDGYDWDTKHGSMVAFVKMLVGAATGKPLDDSIEGKLKV